MTADGNPKQFNHFLCEYPGAARLPGSELMLWKHHAGEVAPGGQPPGHRAPGWLETEAAGTVTASETAPQRTGRPPRGAAGRHLTAFLRTQPLSEEKQGDPPGPF